MVVLSVICFHSSLLKQQYIIFDRFAAVHQSGLRIHYKKVKVLRSPPNECVSSFSCECFHIHRSHYIFTPFLHISRTSDLNHLIPSDLNILSFMLLPFFTLGNGTFLEATVVVATVVLVTPPGILSLSTKP